MIEMKHKSDGNKNIYLEQQQRQQKQQQIETSLFNRSFEYIGAIYFDLYMKRLS